MTKLTRLMEVVILVGVLGFWAQGCAPQSLAHGYTSAVVRLGDGVECLVVISSTGDVATDCWHI